MGPVGWWACLLGFIGVGMGLLGASAVGAQPAPSLVERVPTDTLLHEQWTVEDGLPVNHANALYQTPNGYLWLATFDGLARFDGLTFTVFNASNTPALPSSRLRTIRPGQGSSFWLVTTQDHLIRVTPGPDFETFDVDADYLYATYVDGDSLTWLASQGGLFQYHEGRLAAVFEEQLAPHWVTDVQRDAGGTLWVGTYPDGAWRAADGALTRVDPADGPDLVTTRSEIYARNRTSRCADGTHMRANAEGISREGQSLAAIDSPLTDVLCDRAGNAWATTTHDGLHHYSPHLMNTVGVPEGLSLRNVYSVYEDRQESLWFTGRDGQVSRLQEGVFRHYMEGIHFAEKTGPVVYDSDQAIYEDRDGTLWLGFQVCRPTDRTADGQCPGFDWASGAPRHNGVNAIQQMRDGALWFGTMEGLHRLDDGQWTEFTAADGLSDGHVQYLLETQDGTLYAATLRGGVLRYRDGQFSALTTADGLPSNHVRALYEDDDGFLWIGTEDRGLVRYDPSTGALATVRQADGLYYDGIHQILEDAAGRLWMSTNRGLFWGRRAELNAFIRGETDQVTSVHYTERDGMRNREANGGRQQSAFKASDGRLWFATQNGAVVVDPAEMVRPAPAPQPIIQQVTARGAALTVPRDDGEPLALAPGERSFTVAYTAPSFAAPNRVRFRYQLVGFDEGWVEAGSRREATYTNVPPDHYEFRVAALGPDGTWSEHVAALPLSVAPFYYETRGFLALGVGAVLLLLVAGYRARTLHLRRRQAALQAKVAEQTHALRAEKNKLRAEKQTTEAQAERLLEMDRLKSQLFTNVSHEFRTPLTLTIGPLEDLQSGEVDLPAVAQEKVDLALRNSRRLLRLIGHLLDVAKLEAGAMRLHPEQTDLAAFVRRLARTFVPLAERRRMRFTVEAPPGPLPARFDADRMEQVLANLLSNAFKFTPEGGTVHVSVSSEASAGEDIARVRVRDSGPGIPDEELSHLFERFYQARATTAEAQPSTGIGLSLAKDLTELHGGTLTVESTVGVGTTFTARWPRGVEASAPAPAEPVRTSLLTAEAYTIGEPPSGDGAVRDAAASLDEEPAPSQEDRPTLLIADDNAEIRAYVRSHFAPRYRVLEAADGRAALDTARTRLPDCIISDVMMPNLDGFELVRALQADAATDFLPVLLLTARATDADNIQGLREGADAYLTKPFNMRALQVRVEALIASRQRLKERFATAPPARTAATPSRVPDDVSVSEAAYLEQARAVVDANVHDEDFSVEALAAELDQSRSTVYRRLRDLLDQSPTAFIRTIRLDHGAALLREEQGTVSEVAYAVGFKSVSHFSQSFREHFDVSPSAYRDARFEGASSSAAEA